MNETAKRKDRVLSRSESFLALSKCRNKDAASPKAMDLPDGHYRAERVIETFNKRTGKIEYFISAPWLLGGVF